MVSIYNNIKVKHTFWLNKDNWLISSEDEKYIAIKQTLLESIMRCRNLSDLSFKILEDIDCLTCLLNSHTITNSILMRKINYSRLIKNHDYVLHILNMGVIDESVCQYLLAKSRHLKKNSDIAYKILSSKNNYFYFHYFKQLLKQETFAMSLFNNKKFNNPYSLISLPYHKQISETLIDREGFPNKKTEDSGIKFNPHVLTNIKFVSKHLRKFTGHVLYPFLPDLIKEDKQIGLTMLKYHPEYNILRVDLKTLNNFKACSRFWFYYNDFIDQIKFFGDLFDNDDNLFEALTCLKSIKSSRFNNMAFTQHPMLSFIIAKSSTSQLLKDFLKTEKGEYLLSIPLNSANYINGIDRWIYDELLIVLEKIKLYNKISQFKTIKKHKAIKI